MAAVTRQGLDPSAGHCYEPRPADQGSPDVITNGAPTVRVSDHYPTHCCGPDCHDGNASAGSPTVIVNGLSIHRIGDAISCGDVSANGSPNVFAGDGAFPTFMAVEPGVTLVGGVHVYDNTSEGQAASTAREEVASPTMSSEPAAGAPVSPPPEPVGCDKFPAIITVAETALTVSRHFKLSHCGGIPVAQRGLSASQICCNWASLCTNVLDPIYDQFKFSINSGWRPVSGGKGNTDHGLGLAADLGTGNVQRTIDMFKWIVDSGLPFTQVIYERSGTSGTGWVHVSYNTAPRGQARTMWTYTGGAPYGHGGANGENLPPLLA